jgi:hypothetical protein
MVVSGRETSRNKVITTASFEAVHEDYARAMAWMSALGIRLEPGRTGHYGKVLGHWRDAYKTASKEEAQKVFPDFVSSALEIWDFIRIHRAFADVPVGQLNLIVEKLKKAVTGPLNAAEETPDTTMARNFLFEATVAALVHQPSCRLTAILDAPSDTGVQFEEKKIWLECKRVTRISKIETNVRKASKQLEETLQRMTGSRHRGLVALDVSKILNPGDDIYVASSDAELLRSIDGLMDDFVRNHREKWQRVYEKRSKKVIGTVVRFSFIATSEARRLLVHASQWAVIPRSGISSTDEQLQRSLATAISSKFQR